MTDTMPTQDEVQAVIDCDDVQAWHRMLCRVHAALKAQAEPVGCLSIWRFRGSDAMVNHDFDYYGQLSDGNYTLYTHPPAQPQNARDANEYRQIGWVHPLYLSHPVHFGGQALGIDVSTVRLSSAQVEVFIRAKGADAEMAREASDAT